MGRRGGLSSASYDFQRICENFEGEYFSCLPRAPLLLRCLWFDPRFGLAAKHLLLPGLRPGLSYDFPARAMPPKGELHRSFVGQGTALLRMTSCGGVNN